MDLFKYEKRLRFQSEQPAFRIEMLCFCLCLSCADKLYMGPGQLYQDLQNLIHDLSLVNQISSMIGSLKGNYQVPTEPTPAPT